MKSHGAHQTLSICLCLSLFFALSALLALFLLLQLNFACVRADFFFRSILSKHEIHCCRVANTFKFIFIAFIYLFVIIYFHWFSRRCVCLCTSQGFSFQIGYCETDDQLPGRSLPQYTLYLVVANEKERVDWIRAIRAGKLTTYKRKYASWSMDDRREMHASSR